MSDIRVLEVSGTPFEMGQQHGLAYPAEIQALTQDRLHLSRDKHWTGKELNQPDVLALAEACLPYHEAYAPDLMAELQGMGEATALSLAELIILNGFTDFIDTVYNVDSLTAPIPAHPGADNCTAFIISPDATTDGQAFYGQTWDMHNTATPYVILLHGKPTQGLNFLTLTIIGCVGMIGMNEAGIAVGVNNLMARDGQIGVTWPFVIRQVLAQDNIDAALTCITDVKLAGAHNYLLVDGHGRGYNVEAMSSRYHVEKITSGVMTHTNHCLRPQNAAVERERLPKSRASSEYRLNQADYLLNQGQITLADLFALTRNHGPEFGICAHPTAPFFVESCSAAVMRPASKEMWAVWGNPCQNEYQRFVL